MLMITPPGTKDYDPENADDAGYDYVLPDDLQDLAADVADLEASLADLRNEYFGEDD